MVRIYSDYVRKYEKVIKKGYREGDPRTESVYINFTDGALYFKLDGVFQGKLSLGGIENAEEAESLETNGIWVDLLTFTTLCSEYPWIEFDPGEKTFSYGEEEFHLSTIVEDFDSVDFDYSEEDDVDSYEFDSNGVPSILNAYGYVPANDTPINGKNFHGISFIGDKVAGSDSLSLYEGVSGVQVNSEYPVKLHPQSKVVFDVMRDQDLHLEMSVVGQRIYFNFDNGELILYFPEVANLYTPDLLDPGFRSKIEYDTYVNTELTSLMDIMAFFQSFKGKSSEDYIGLSVDDTNNLGVKYKNNKNTGKRYVSVSEKSDALEGVETSVFLGRLRQAVSTLSRSLENKEKEVQIQIPVDEGKPTINVVIPDNNSEHVTMARMSVD